MSADTEAFADRLRRLLRRRRPWAFARAVALLLLTAMSTCVGLVANHHRVQPVEANVKYARAFQDLKTARSEFERKQALDRLFVIGTPAPYMLGD